MPSDCANSISKDRFCIVYSHKIEVTPLDNGDPASIDWELYKSSENKPVLKQLSRGPTEYTHGHKTSHRYCLAQDEYNFVKLTNDFSFTLKCYDKTDRKFINIQPPYALSKCERATGIILSGHASHGMRYLDSNYKEAKWVV